MTRTTQVRGLGALVAVALLSGCGPTDARPGHALASGTAAAATQPSGAGDVHGESIFPAGLTECVGTLPADAVRAPHLPATDDVTEATVCSESQERVPGNGIWTVRRVTDLTGARLAALVNALRVPATTLPAGIACAGVGHVIPAWALTLADGRHVQPAIPGDGCEPSADVLGQLTAAAHSTDAVVSRVHQLRSEALAASGCYDDTKFMVTEPPKAAVAAAPRPVRQGAVTICQFGMTDGSGVEGKDGVRMPTLAAFGDSAAIAAAVDRVYESFTPGSPSSCAKDRPSAALTVQAPDTGDAGNAGPQTYLEVGGCNLVLDAGIQIIGSADPHAIAALSALATQSAPARAS